MRTVLNEFPSSRFLKETNRFSRIQDPDYAENFTTFCAVFLCLESLFGEFRA